MTEVTIIIEDKYGKTRINRHTNLPTNHVRRRLKAVFDNLPMGDKNE